MASSPLTMQGKLGHNPFSAPGVDVGGAMGLGGGVPRRFLSSIFGKTKHARARNCIGVTSRFMATTSSVVQTTDSLIDDAVSYVHVYCTCVCVRVCWCMCVLCVYIHMCAYVARFGQSVNVCMCVFSVCLQQFMPNTLTRIVDSQDTQE